ncbi:MAG: alkaline phosphatase [Lutibacter sp.]|nr:MAG: alkaline phosphatase [Lutibacter sp.]
MKYFLSLTLLLFMVTGCKNAKEGTNISKTTIESDFTIAFGSCNKQWKYNPFWKEIQQNNPNVWIWGGDIIYSDTDDMKVLEKNYNVQRNNPEYTDFRKNVEVIGTWDDHDYGLNDGGIEYSKKAESQQLFLDFIDVSKDDERRKQEGVYATKEYKIGKNSVKVIILDTRYFRTALTPDNESKKRYKPSIDKKNSMLGDTQWNWLENELKTSKANFNIIVSSIQFLSAEHGFESWGTMPNEVKKLENLLMTTNAKNTIILSGDRHISEFSKKEVEGLSYPLIDFTASGLTHSYSSFSGEPNKYRVKNVVSVLNYGVLKFNFSANNVLMEIRGKDNVVLESYSQNYN